MLGYGTAKLFERHKNRIAFAALAVFIVLVFCWLKRYTFFPESAFLPFPYVAIGLSYVFFRVLHLIIDAYQDALPEPIGLAGYVSYTLNFTCLVSGPIQLFQDYRRTESVEPASLSWIDVGKALDRIVIGYFKVAVLSPLLWTAHAYSVGELGAASDLIERVIGGALVLTVYPVYLYINFSGYTDFVIGSARFLRLELPENFNHPFISEGFIEFWGRWHMTLSNWWKTYVYSPLFIDLDPTLPLAARATAAGHRRVLRHVFLRRRLARPDFDVPLSRRSPRTRRQRQQTVSDRDDAVARPRAIPIAVSELVVFDAFASGDFLLLRLRFPLVLVDLEPARGLRRPARAAAGSPERWPSPSCSQQRCWPRSRSRWIGTETEPSWDGPSYRCCTCETAWYAAVVIIIISVTVVLSAPAPAIVYRAF